MSSSLTRLSRSASSCRSALVWRARKNIEIFTVSQLRTTHHCTVVIGMTSARLSSLQPTGSAIRQQQQQQQKQQLLQLQQVRFKRHAAKMGHHLETLDDMAHEKSHEEAQERRQKKKDKKVARKGGGGKKEDDSSKKKAATGTVVDEDDDHSDNEDHSDDDDNEEEQQEGDDEMLLPDPTQVKERMMKIVNRFSDSLKTMRGAEPTVEIFDDVVVNAYGSSNTSLKSVALVVLESPTLAVATCYDPALAKNVCNAIQEKLELNPSIVQDGTTSSGSGDGGATIRIPIPRVSMETRQKTALALKKRAESHRQLIRKQRRTALDIVKQGVAGKLEGICKDDAFRVQKEIETMTDQVIHKLNEIADQKHDSIMAV